MSSIVWFRLDLRLADNPALAAAREQGGPVVPVFIHAPDEEAPWPPGGASRWWLHQSLKALGDSLASAGSRLILRAGPTLETLLALAKETGADAVFWNRRYEPAIIARDARLKEVLRGEGFKVSTFNGALLHEPWSIGNKSGKPFQVFTPFWRRCLDQDDPPKPLREPRHLGAPDRWPKSVRLESLELEPRAHWASGLRNAWQPGESAAAAAHQRFLCTAFEDYSDGRNRPDLIGTSRLSPHLHFGEISPRQVWHQLRETAVRRGWPIAKWRGSQFIAELGWREFAHHLLFHFPHTPSEPLRPNFKRFPWRDNPDCLKAWKQGRTGFPIIDAGMRELWATGWMHNRVRMIVASFLVKNLLVTWREGAAWFWDTLVDADLAQNTLGWQWTAGCGADAAPFFRIFNPVSQGEKFDPHGQYVRRWCPELKRLSDRWIHQPFNARADVLADSSIELGRDYPQPIVSLTISREVALEAFARTKH